MCWETTIDPASHTVHVRSQINPAAGLRNTPATCASADSSTGYIDGSFGPSRITITSFIASTTRTDSVFGAGDLFTMFFSENTNQGGYSSAALLNQFQISLIFNFSQNIGELPGRGT